MHFRPSSLVLVFFLIGIFVSYHKTWNLLDVYYLMASNKWLNFPVLMYAVYLPFRLKPPATLSAKKNQEEPVQHQWEVNIIVELLYCFDDMAKYMHAKSYDICTYLALLRVQDES